MIVTCDVIFKGSVQGVGFRCTACHMARENGLAGWVKNCPDGSVHLLAEGEETRVGDLIARLGDHFRVDEKQVSRLTVRHGLTGFTIIY